MAKCPCGCGRKLSPEEEMALKFKSEGREGFPDIFSDLFGGGRSGRGGMGGLLGIDMLKRRLANASEEERDEILKGAPKEVLDALGVERVTTRKRPEHILAEAELTGSKARIKHLSNTIEGYYAYGEKTAAEIKKLKKGRKKDQERMQELEGTIEDLKDRLSDTQVGFKRSEGRVKSLKEGIDNLQSIVAKKNEEISVLAGAAAQKDLTIAALSSAVENIKNAIGAVDTNGTKADLLEAIVSFRNIVTEAFPEKGGNGEDHSAAEEAVVTHAKETAEATSAGSPQDA